MGKGCSLFGCTSLQRVIHVSLGCFLAAVLSACNSGGSNTSGGSVSDDQSPGEHDHSDDTDSVVARFDYAVEDIAPLGILGFRLYANARLICAIDDPYRHRFYESDCDRDVINGLEPPVHITVTAFREGDAAAESAYSNTVLIDR